MDFKALVEQLVKLYFKLNKQQRIVIAAVIIFVVGFIVFLILFNAKPEKDGGRKILFDKLSPADAALVVGQLEKDGVEYELKDDRTILVDEEVVYKERIAIAALGLPKDNRVGFELFDTQEFGSTSFDQNIKYLRALEGELSRTIEALRPIDSASVHLAIPKESVFVSKATPPTASVAVKFEQNMRLTRKQVTGIKHLIAASVPKMAVENVTVVDADGVPLGEGDEFTESSEHAKAQMIYKKRLENTYETKIV
ncbi:MAG: flagellar basal-body MS-ring/collar protein FliF, partial [Thiovulaceae bacterium]|nr:flagellar basal-body MS-ring/collar protein FliF [Sulfurimonadaceae bacterium]